VDLIRTDKRLRGTVSHPFESFSSQKPDRSVAGWGVKAVP